MIKKIAPPQMDLFQVPPALIQSLSQALKKEIVAQLKQLLLQARKTKSTGENHDE